MRRILVIITIALHLYVLRLWLLCRKLQYGFHIDRLHVNLQIEDITHAERNMPLTLVRAFDNKVVGYTVEAARQFVHYWDPTFLVVFLSIAGMFGVVCGLYYFFAKKRNPFVIAGISGLLIIQSAEIFLYPHIPYHVELLVLWVGYQVLSFFGLWSFTEDQKKSYRTLIWVGMLVLSIGWLMLFQSTINLYCAK